MDSLFPIIFMILAVLGAFLVIGGVVYLIVYLTRNKDSKPMKLSISLLVKVYLYIISFITLIVALFGGTILLKAASSYAFGIPFSYTLYAVTEVSEVDYYGEDMYLPEKCYDSTPTMINNVEVCFDESERTQDLVNGATFFVSMLILFGIHQLGIYRMEKKSPTEWLKKTYLFLSLILYSVIGVITIPVSIYQLSNYLLSGTGDFSGYYEAPAVSLSLLLLTIPLWIFFLVKTMKMKTTD